MYEPTLGFKMPGSQSKIPCFLSGNAKATVEKRDIKSIWGEKEGQWEERGGQEDWYGYGEIKL